MTQRAATKVSAKIIGMIALIIAKNGLPKLFYLRLAWIYSGVKLTPPAENTTRNITAAIKSR